MTDTFHQRSRAMACCGAACALLIVSQLVALAQQPAPNHLRSAPSAVQPQSGSVLTPGVRGGDVAPPIQSSWKLANLTPAEFEARLFGIWGSRAHATEDVATQTATFRLPAGAGGETIVSIDRLSAQVSVAAPERIAQSWLKVLKGIDARPAANGRQAAVFPIANSDPATLQRTIALLRGTAAARQASHKKQHIGQFVAMFFQPDGAQPAPDGGAQPLPDGAQPPPAEGEAGDAVGAVGDSIFSGIGDVRIEILEDFVIVTGKKEDVEKVMRIIEEIERQSLETLPEVEIYYLKHVDGVALNTLIQQVYTTSIGTRLGTVTITPLVKPNALMLIGRKDTIPPVIELIQKLDRPTPPQTQIRVFHLQHMSAIDAERTIRQFFVGRPGFDTNPRVGLDVQAQVIAEFRANALIVQASPRDMEEIARLVESLDQEDSPAKNEVRVFKLRNSLAEELAPALQEAITGVGAGGQQVQQQQQQQQPQGGTGQGATSPATATRRATSLQFLRIDPNGEQLLQSGVLADMRISADTRSNSLIVVGPTGSMELMAALIRQLDDLPAAVAELKVFTIVNGDAQALAEMLQNLFATEQAGPGGQAATAGLQTATGAGESTLVPLRFSVDQRTNSIIASGNPGDLNVIYQILTRLDEGDIRQRVTTVYRLHNAPAADVAAALNTLLDTQRQLNQAAPELVSPYEQIEREVIIVQEPVTNSLIVSATPRYYEEIKKVIEELDRRPPMVMIQVVIAEVQLGDVDQFGIEWGLQDSLMFDRSILTNRFNFNNSLFPNDNTPASLATRENVAGQALQNLALGRIDPTLGFGGLVLTASNESVQVLLRALEQSTRAQIISRPQIQTLDNQAARIAVGALVPRITGATTNQIGLTNPTVEDQEVGIILQVQPRTSPDGTIVMQIYAEKSVVGPEATGIPIFTDAAGNVIRSPQIPITSAQTTVSAKTGQTIILGGLITKDQTEVTRRVPYLGDIPVLGRTFRFDSVTQNRTELLIIMTPYIVTSQEHIDAINQMETERMSWCIADIVNIHGPIGVAGNPHFNGEMSPLIFPDSEPLGPVIPAPPDQPLPLPPPMPPGLMSQPDGTTTPAPGGLELPPPSGLGQLPSNARPPGMTAQPGSLVPQMIHPALPPAGTQAGIRPLGPQSGPGQVVPANYQQPVR